MKKKPTKTVVTEKKKTTTKTSNPPGYVLGRVVEIRYERTVGKHRGQFKHTFKRGNGVLVAGYDKQGRKVILVRKEK